MRLSIIPLLLVSSYLHSETITGVGIANITDSITERSACNLAESYAIENALSDNFGMEVNSEINSYCLDTNDQVECNAHKEIKLNTSGTVEKILRKFERIENGVCKVTVDLDVVKSRYHRIDVTGKRIYKVGQNLDFDINVKEPYYLHIFNVHGKTVDLIFPLDYNYSNTVNVGYELPKYQAFLKPWQFKSSENLVFLFTKYDIRFDHNSVDESVMEEMINSIPSFSKRVFRFNIIIKR
jgi:hypothetical protein